MTHVRSTGGLPSCCAGVFVSALLTLSTSAFPASISLHTDPQGASCVFTHPPLGQTTPVYLILKHSGGHVGARFAVSLPAPSPYTISGSSVPAPFLSLGEPESGIEIAFTQCVVGDAVIMRLDLMRIADPTTDCLSLRLNAHPSAATSSPELVDCSQPIGSFVAVGEGVLWIQGEDGCAPMPEPSQPSPADGATGIAVDVTLDCVLHDDGVVFSDCVPLHGGRWLQVYFGADPDPPLARIGSFPHAVGPLAPNTTYYWKVDHRFGPAHATSPVWSFTTANATPVKTSTWGIIKALYR